jgi:hypothetical protein
MFYLIKVNKFTINYIYFHKYNPFFIILTKLLLTQNVPLFTVFTGSKTGIILEYF